MTDQATWVRIIRAFDAPIDVVWDMWTKPELFKQWYGPTGMRVARAEMDVVVGGTRKICLEMPERGLQMWFTGIYREVSRPTRLVYTEAMCDADGTLLSPQSMGMPKGHPDITEVIVELREEGGTTRMTMVHVGVPEGSAGAGGWSQAFDTLGTVLEGRAAQP